MCVCLLVVFSISGTLLVIVLLTLFLGCGSVCLIDDYSAMGTVEVMHSACVCILSVVLFISDTLLVTSGHFWSLSHRHCFSVVGVFVSSIIIQLWKQ